MKLYSDFATRRARQIFADVGAVLVLVGGIVLATSVYNAIVALDQVGRDVQQAGGDFSRSMSDIGGKLAGVPLIGRGIRAPFDAASAAGGTLSAAGQRWQDGVQTLATTTGWTIALIVVAVVVAAWLIPRVVGARRRGAISRLGASPSALDLLALRALTRRRPQDLAGIDASAVVGWRRGDAAVIRMLAEREASSYGVRLASSQ